MAKPKKNASANPVTAAADPATAVWIATLAADGRRLRLAASSWYAARCLAMVAFGCEPSEVKVREAKRK